MADAFNQTIGSLWIGEPGGAASNFAVDANNDGVGWHFQPDSADAITHLGFRYGARTGTPPTYSIRIESPDASGLPDGTDVGGGSPTAVTFTPPADASINGLWQWKALTNSYTPTRGQFLIATIRYSSGTIDGSNNSSFSTHFAGGFGNLTTYPPPLTLTAGTWAKFATAGRTSIGWRTAGGRFGFVSTGVYNTAIATTGHRQAMHMTLPAGHGDTFQVRGMQLVMTTPIAANAVKFGIWDAAGTELQGIQLDSDFCASAASRRGIEINFDETTLATLSYGTKYYYGVEVVSSASIVLTGLQLQEADDRYGWPGGTDRGLSTWTGASWADTDTVIPIVVPKLADITEPTGGGSPYFMGFHPIESGGA